MTWIQMLTRLPFTKYTNEPFTNLQTHYPFTSVIAEEAGLVLNQGIKTGDFIICLLTPDLLNPRLSWNGLLILWWVFLPPKLRYCAHITEIPIFPQSLNFFLFYQIGTNGCFKVHNVILWILITKFQNTLCASCFRSFWNSCAWMSIRIFSNKTLNLVYSLFLGLRHYDA